jgi:hypothetical protein
MIRRLHHSFLCSVILGMAASTSVAAQSAARLRAEPAQLELRVGESKSVTITAFDAAGNVIEVPLRIAGPRRAVRIDDGEVTGLEVGEFEIVASVAMGPTDRGEPVTLTIPVTVGWPAISRVDVRAATPGTLYTGTTIGHVAHAFHDDGTRRPDPTFRWSSSNPAVAQVDAFGHVTAVGAGSVTVTADADGARASVSYEVARLPAARLELHDPPEQVRTGDVVDFRVNVTNAPGQRLSDVPVTWSHTYTAPEGIMAPPAPGQMRDGKFVADVPGVYTVIASAGALSTRHSFEVKPRDVVQGLEIVGHGRQSTMRTTDFWVFEGADGRDYAITGSKVADGHAFVFDVSDPSSIVKTDSVQVDARAVNDVKVSPDGRYATMTREGASNRRNGVVILDLANPAHPVIASSYEEGLTGGVHNAFPTNDYIFALSDGDKYVILDVRDIYNPTYVSEYNHPDSRVHDVWVHNGIAYSAEWGTGVVAVDVGNGRWGGSIDNPVFIMSYPVPTGRTHAVFPYEQEDTGKFYLFVGDEIMNRSGLALQGTSGPEYTVPYDPATGLGGVPLYTQGYIQVIDFTDPEHPEMVARYEVSEYGTHNIWVEDDVLYQAYYEGGLRMVDVSGELMGNLYTQGREIAAFKSADPAGYVANSPMVWSAMPFKGHVFFSDTNSGLWAVKLEPKERPVS